MVWHNLLLATIILAFGLSSANPCLDSDQVNSKITGGFPTEIGETPWQASLQYVSVHSCGGTIISDRWVLSAAHCFGNLVRVGSALHAEGGIVVGIKYYFTHPKYSERPIDYDFALLELEEPLNFTDKIQPAAIPDDDTKIADGTISLVSGWGYTNNESESSDQLRAVRVPIFKQEECKKLYPPTSLWQITDRMICAGYEEGGRGPCNGDSGGPLVEFSSGIPRVIGVVSWGKGCSLSAGVYSRVSSVRSWIKDITGL